MKHLKTYETLFIKKDVDFSEDDDITTLDLKANIMSENNIIEIFEQAVYDAISNLKTFVATRDYSNIYVRDLSGKMKRFFHIEDKGRNAVSDYVFYFNNKKYNISQQFCAKLRSILTLLLGLYEKVDSYHYSPIYLSYVNKDNKNKVDSFWIEASEKLGRETVVRYLTTIGDKVTDDRTGNPTIPLIIRSSKSTIGSKYKIILPKTTLMVIEEEPSAYNKIKDCVTPGLLKKIPNDLTRSSSIGLWGLLGESKKEEPTEKELFLKYYSDLYIKKNYNELDIWKAYDDGFIDKEDAIEFVKKFNDSYIKDFSDYCAIKLYLADILPVERFMLKYTDLLIHKGELKWFINEFSDLPGVDDNLAKVMDSDHNLWDHYFADYDMNDIWYHCSEEFKKELLEYCYNKEFTYDGEDYILKQDMVVWKDVWRSNECFIKLGNKEVEFKMIIDESFDDIHRALELALNRTDEDAYWDAYREEGENIIKYAFGEYEQIKHGKSYVYIFDPDFGKIADSIENSADGDEEELMKDEYMSYNSAYSNTVFEDNGGKVINYNYEYSEGNPSYSIKDKYFEEHALDCFSQEGIKKENEK